MKTDVSSICKECHEKVMKDDGSILFVELCDECAEAAPEWAGVGWVIQAPDKEWLIRWYEDNRGLDSEEE